MSEKLGQLLLKGWTMLSDSCPMGCSVPLMENRREQPPKSVCVQCEKQFIRRMNSEGEVEYLMSLTEEERKSKELEEEEEKQRQKKQKAEEAEAEETKRNRELLERKQERMREEEEKKRQLKLEQQRNQLQELQSQMVDETLNFINPPISSSSSSSSSHRPRKNQQRQLKKMENPATSSFSSYSSSNERPTAQSTKRISEEVEDEEEEEDRLRNRALKVAQRALYHKLEEIGESLETKVSITSLQGLEWTTKLSGVVINLTDSILALDRLK